MIIADDEHNSSYKQWDQNPRYHGIKVAQELARIWQAKIILSSPTPSIENYHFSENNKEFLKIELVEKKRNIISRKLIWRMKEKLEIIPLFVKN